jgi:hypothetical protein
LLQATRSLRILTVVVLIDDLLEDRLISSGVGEQRHRGAQLDRVNATEYLLSAASLLRGDDFGAFDQPRSEYGMCEIGLRLSEIADRVRLSRGAAPQAGDLRKDESQRLPRASD